MSRSAPDKQSLFIDNITNNFSLDTCQNTEINCEGGFAAREPYEDLDSRLSSNYFNIGRLAVEKLSFVETLK